MNAFIRKLFYSVLIDSICLYKYNSDTMTPYNNIMLKEHIYYWYNIICQM